MIIFYFVNWYHLYYKQTNANGVPSSTALEASMKDPKYANALAFKTQLDKALKQCEAKQAKNQLRPIAIDDDFPATICKLQ